jgi:hypothetical protein
MSHVLTNISRHYLSLTTAMVVNGAFRDLPVLGPAFLSTMTEAIPLPIERLSHHHLPLWHCLRLGC